MLYQNALHIKFFSTTKYLDLNNAIGGFAFGQNQTCSFLKSPTVHIQTPISISRSQKIKPWLYKPFFNSKTFHCSVLFSLCPSRFSWRRVFLLFDCTLLLFFSPASLMASVNRWIRPEVFLPTLIFFFFFAFFLTVIFK